MGCKKWRPGSSRDGARPRLKPEFALTIAIGLLVAKRLSLWYDSSVLEAGSSIGRAAVSKTAGCRFDSCPACHMLQPGGVAERLMAVVLKTTR